MDLLAAEIMARSGKGPDEIYRDLEGRFGVSAYERVDEPAGREQKDALKRLSPEMIQQDTLAGEAIREKLTHAKANGEPIGGIKVVSENAWFAARPSGTEDVYKVYAESFKGEDHLKRVQEEARAIVQQAFKAAGA